MDIKWLIKNRMANCVYKDDKILVYEIVLDDQSKFRFSIDITNKADVGEEAVFNDTEKAIMLMRWIRRAIDNDDYTITE